MRAGTLVGAVLLLGLGSARADEGESPVSRVIATFNPELSAAIDVTGGYAGALQYRPAADDPNLGGLSSTKPAGFALQDVELGLRAGIDRYFRASLFITVENLSVFQVDEGYATTTSLPYGLQVKAGIFRSAFGRENAEHLHDQDFTRRPEVYAAYLGDDGLHAPGVQLSWVTPLPFHLQVLGEAFSVALPTDLANANTFGGGQRTDLTYTVEAKVAIPVMTTLAISGGLSAAFGNAVVGGFLENNVLTDSSEATSQLLGANLEVTYAQWSPTGGRFFSLAWQSELFARHVDSLCARGEAGGCGSFLPPQASLTDDTGNEFDAGFYSQLVAHLGPHWIAAARFDLLGVPTSAIQGQVNRESLSFTWAMSDFSRLRLYGEREQVIPIGATNQPLGGGVIPGASEIYAAYLQLEVTLGAHAAHAN